MLCVGGACHHDSMLSSMCMCVSLAICMYLCICVMMVGVSIVGCCVVLHVDCILLCVVMCVLCVCVWCVAIHIHVQCDGICYCVWLVGVVLYPQYVCHMIGLDCVVCDCIALVLFVLWCVVFGVGWLYMLFVQCVWCCEAWPCSVGGWCGMPCH